MSIYKLNVSCDGFYASCACDGSSWKSVLLSLFSYHPLYDYDHGSLLSVCHKPQGRIHSNMY